MLIARNLGPAELLEYDRRRLKAVLLEEGSLTAHMTIVARAMGVPVIGRLADIRHSVDEGETILVDGDSGSVMIRPNRALVSGFEQRLAMSHKRRAQMEQLRPLPAVTKDGLKVSVMVNAGLAEDAAHLDMSGADGIGLFRTEFQFLVVGDAARARAPAAALFEGARASRATSRWCSAPSISAATRRFPISPTSMTRPKIRRWAGARCAFSSTARR